jgi:glycosyltransferase involved in cell wall biosynthesis
MDNVSISVVIPAYNGGAFLRDAVQSAIAQTLGPLEILVIDDGSQDDTFEVASSYGPPVRALRKANGGPASARNVGIREAHGEWIAFLDADDIWLPQKLEKQVKLTDSDVGIVCARASNSPEFIPGDITLGQLWKRNYIANSTALVRRTAITEIGGLDEDPTLIGVEDYNLWLRIVAAGWKVRSVPEELCICRVRHDSVSGNTERQISGIFANFRKLGCGLLDPEQFRKQELSLYDEYGRVFLYCRDLRNARRLLKEGLRRELTIRRVIWFSAACMPRRVLDWSRSLKAKLRAFSSRSTQPE